MVAWAVGLEIGVVVVLTLLPARMVPDNTVGGEHEHAVAYLALAVLPTVAVGEASVGSCGRCGHGSAGRGPGMTRLSKCVLGLGCSRGRSL